MASYRVFETETFRGDLERLGRAGLARLRRKLGEYVYPALRVEPHVGPTIRRLKGFEPPTWRVRIGAWRFFYEISESDRVVSMTAADHRSEAYR